MERSNDDEARRRSLAPEAIVPVLACVLNQLCARNDQLPVDQAAITKFHALKPPSISIREYLERISKYAACSGECFVLALVYVDRIIQNNHTFVVNSLNVHRLLITSIMLAAKFFDDQYFNNAYYAKVGGVPCGEMNSLEIEFLFMLNFNLFGATETFQQYFIELCKHTLNSPCDCHSGPPLYALRQQANGLSLEYDLARRVSHATILMTPSPTNSQSPQSHSQSQSPTPDGSSSSSGGEKMDVAASAASAAYYDQHDSSSSSSSSAQYGLNPYQPSLPQMQYHHPHQHQHQHQLHHHAQLPQHQQQSAYAPYHNMQ